MTVDRRFLGLVDVDSGTLLIGDPMYVLPSAESRKPGVDYAAVIAVDANLRSAQLADRPVILLQRFGGDGTYPVYGEFEDGEFIRAIVEFVEPDEDE
jgi:hypothetical protein